jgi:hypothetical protein
MSGMRVAPMSNYCLLMTFRLDPHNDPNEAYEVIQTQAWLRGPPTNWWTVLANGIPVKHYPPRRKALAIQYATDPAYRALLVMYDQALGARRRPRVASAPR